MTIEMKLLISVNAWPEDLQTSISACVFYRHKTDYRHTRFHYPSNCAN